MTIPTPTAPDSFDLLHPGIRRWTWQQGWGDLRPIQRAAIPSIVAGDRDVIVAAQTAGGKTEAAFLPLISRIADEPGGGFRLLYVSPLKALINDQFRRLDALCEALEVPVYRWHGDVSASQKQKARQRPSGILLMTPESLEATFARRGLEIPRLFGALDAVVIDELHAFIGAERGRQLQSLLHRLEVSIDRRITRIGLSATLGDMALAADFLRPGEGERVELVEDTASDQSLLRLQLRGFTRTALAAPADAAQRQLSAAEAKEELPEDADEAVQRAMAEHLYKTLRGGRHLVFAGRRGTVEELSDLLRLICERDHVPNEFFPHHANLSRDHRAYVEERLREGPLPTTAVCTATLELGIDIGDIASVVQVGPPWSVASLRQRMGRSGRRAGHPATLRLLVAEQELRAGLTPPDALRFGLTQAVAMVSLLLRRWVEPPRPASVDLSTLAHQTLALIAERGGVPAKSAWEILCRNGPFGLVPPRLYAALLRAMGRPEAGLIEQAADGTLLLGEAGERLVDHYDFYSVFQTSTEFRVVHGGTTLGTLPVVTPLAAGMTIIFSGRRWTVTAVVDREKLIEVVPSSAGRPPPFGGGGGDLHDTVVETMREVYAETGSPGFLDGTAKALLAEARAAYTRYGLAGSGAIDDEGHVWLFPWVGTVKLGTLALALRARDIDANMRGVALEIIGTTREKVVMALDTIASAPAPDAMSLAATATNRSIGKYDAFLTDDLLLHSFASQKLEPAALPEIARRLLKTSPL
ncbi:ATP-dependent helicase [Azospirillum sp. TSH7]|uniref:DEAD/DEAH box helicase n=1 Tax=unclassified Azospirillum TaxID=2630922 RepID=UPI000D60C99E|nr:MULTISPECIES: DEAD/DEAH box helicase [unclassified Azospirillum]PWC56302.1 ATP-dependent helicase [Azospirillum sp. TSH7]PWC61791.1 ATP-dependent helicase [Azospirillum sp. TSH20]